MIFKNSKTMTKLPTVLEDIIYDYVEQMHKVEHREKFNPVIQQINSTNGGYRSNNNIRTFNPFFSCYYLRLLGGYKQFDKLHLIDGTVQKTLTTNDTFKVKRVRFDKCRYNGCKTYL